MKIDALKGTGQTNVSEIKEKRMKIVIFGGTGALGQSLVQQSLELGHEVLVLVRTPSKMTMTHEALTIVQGDGKDINAVSKAIKGQDIVLCAVGGQGLSDSTTRSSVTENIIAGMKEHNVSTLVTCSSLGAGESMHHLPLFSRWMAKTILRNAIDDHSKQEKMIRESGCDWVIIRPPRLIDTEKTETYRIAEESEPFSASQVSRADVAHFMLKVMNDKKFYKQAYTISV